MSAAQSLQIPSSSLRKDEDKIDDLLLFEENQLKMEG